MENINDVAKIAFNEIYIANEVKCWEEMGVSDYCTPERIAKNLEEAKNKTVDDYIEIPSMDDFKYISGENDNYIIESIESEGSDGMNDMFCVFKLTDKNTKESTLIRFAGQYNSWDSDYWDDTCEEVEAKTRKETYYTSTK